MDEILHAIEIGLQPRITGVGDSFPSWRQKNVAMETRGQQRQSLEHGLRTFGVQVEAVAEEKRQGIGS